MKFSPLILAAGLWTLSTCSLRSGVTYVPSAQAPPAPAREFRGAWVATVRNIDWPSKPGLTTAQQQSELLAILNRAVALKLNAVILQVRPACDAFYRSPYEPWSEFLTGHMGRAPAPFYDPLALAVQEAHRRGLELHAWFNPFRARDATRAAASPEHISRTHPELVRSYGSQLWLDPGERAVQDYSRKVILDVVKRYDIDAVHIDDYFYPYPERRADGRMLEFPDSHTYARYLASGGKLSRGDWRRANVDEFVERLYRGIKSVKPWVKFGISPFGIWRPHFPAQIEGFDAYEGLYADARKWLRAGWLDYFSPQLYWRIEPTGQSYPVLLKWWEEQNVKRRHLWPGNNTVKAGGAWPAQEIVDQIKLTRAALGANGNVHWSMTALMENKGGISDSLRRVYKEPALVPASSWLDKSPPGKPALTVTPDNELKVLRLTWEPSDKGVVRSWVVQVKRGKKWETSVLPGWLTFRTFLGGASAPEAMAVTAVDRCGVAGKPAVVELRK